MSNNTPQLPLFTAKPSEPTQEIPYGYCQCGCGERTQIAKRNDKRDGSIKGQPVRFISGHNGRKHPIPENPNPGGLCMCGCGLPAPIAKRNNARRGIIKGQPSRYLPGHGRAKGEWGEPPNPSGLCMCGCGQPTPIARQSNLRTGNIIGHPMRYIRTHGERRPLADRFWEKVNKSGPIHPVLGTGCWLWTASTNMHGYGQLNVDRRPVLAPRLSWELHSGMIPDGMCVLHRCDTPACVNPAHLFLGTMAENTQDMIAKGRDRLVGSRSKAAKLNEHKVADIKRRLARGERRAELAREYGVNGTTIGHIQSGSTWKHVP